MRQVGIVLLVANILLAVLKGAVWLESGSLAIGSEAVNSVGDSIYSLIVLAGLYLTTQPPDLEHPHGHERIEPFVSLVVAVGVIAAGLYILWQSATTIVSGSVDVTVGPAVVGVLLLTATVKYGLYRYCLHVGKQTQSPALVATALDNRMDLLTVAAALVGVLGARFGLPLLDPAAAAVVAVGILYTGWTIIRDNVDYLVGRAPPERLRAEIVQCALEHPDVEGVHDVIAHYVGPEIDVSLHIEVEGDRTIREAHDIETQVVDSIESLPEVDDVFVHVDPKELGEWKDDDTVEHLANGKSDSE